MARILIFVVFVIFVIALYMLLHGAITNRRLAKRESSPVNPNPLDELTSQYHNIDPELQEWFALNSATALGMTPEQFIKATQKPSR